MACRVFNGARLTAAHPGVDLGCPTAQTTEFGPTPANLGRLRAPPEPAALNGPGSPAAPSATVMLDTSYLNQLCRDIGPEGVAEMVHIFREDAPSRMAAIQRGMANGSIQIVRREAHALAGAAGTVGLPRLSETAFALQTASERARPTAAAIAAVAGALSDSLPLLSHWVQAQLAFAGSRA